MGLFTKGMGAILKKGKEAISSVKPSIHKTKKAQKTAEMKILFNKQKNRTIHERNKASAKLLILLKEQEKIFKRETKQLKKCLKTLKEKNNDYCN
jgi:3-oxoacyl-[acyl-carrier-protein] synthase III